MRPMASKEAAAMPRRHHRHSNPRASAAINKQVLDYQVSNRLKVRVVLAMIVSPRRTNQIQLQLKMILELP